MSLTSRTLLLIALIVLLANVGLWSSDPLFRQLWLIPAALLLFGLAVEGWRQRRVGIEVAMAGDTRARLGRPLDLVLNWRASRATTLRFMAAGPAGVEIEPRIYTLRIGPDGAASHIAGLAVGLGRAGWPPLRGRVRGLFGLAWWTRGFRIPGEVRVEPDALGMARRAGSFAGGASRRALAGSGAELHELREYRRGDPLRSIDWKASARLGRWIARDRFAEQHLEIMLVLDIGRTSGIAISGLTRLGHYVNAACRFAEHAAQNEDRVGLVTFADRPLAALVPAHGLAAIMRLRTTLAAATSLPRESNPLPAAARVLAMCRQRALVVLMLDLDDVGSHGQLGQAVRLLRPKHLPVVCGLLSPELFDLRDGTARRWLDPFVSLAAAEQIARLRAGAAALRQLGAPVVLTAPAQFEETVFATYDRMRARRRV
ncbi:MAG: DUF58 domain-containing protein [Steroidobacteraceae bacterium]